MNRGFIYTETVDGRGRGEALLDYLASRYRHTSSGLWAERIAGGQVLVDGRRAAPDAVLRPGQIIVWNRPPWSEPEAPLHYAELHRDGHLLAVAKPPGLPTLPGAGFLEHTLLALVRRRHPGAAPVHRLGRGTSGIVLFAMTPEAARRLEASWRGRDVTKVYRALITGHPVQDAFTIETPIGPIAHPALGTVNGPSPSGKPSRSLVRVLERRDGRSLVEVTIETGRPHQIRIHLAAAGHPLVDDPFYDVGGAFKPNALPGDSGYLLHALRLSLPHPATGEPFTVSCPAPSGLN